jgi:pimeloyl-ACP methyl ester carboxylesterase
MREPGPVEAEVLRELGPTFAAREVSAGGAALRVLEGGAGPPIVLLHGRGNAATTWFPILPALARAHRVIAIDLPGFGSSGAPPSPPHHDASSGIRFFADPVEALLVREGLGQAAIVGHSLGGRVALELELRRNVAPEKLALVCAMGLGPHAGFGARVYFHLGPEKLARALGPRIFRRISTSPDTPIGRRLQKLSYEIYSVPHGRDEADRAFRALAPLFGPLPDVADRLGEVRPETLVFWGENDEALPAPMAIAGAAKLRRSRLHIARAGHSPHLEDPTGFSEVLLDFLSDAPRSR